MFHKEKVCAIGYESLVISMRIYRACGSGLEKQMVDTLTATCDRCSSVLHHCGTEKYTPQKECCTSYGRFSIGHDHDRAMYILAIPY